MSLKQRVLQGEAVDFDVRQDDGTAGTVDHGLGLGERGAEGFRIAFLVQFRSGDDAECRG